MINSDYIIGLRWLFLAACLGCVVLVSWNGRWEGHLIWLNTRYIVNLKHAPIWAPPPVPPYAKFQHDFKDSKGFPTEDRLGLTIERELKLDWMAVDLLEYLWLVTGVGGLLYLAVRGKRRDLILHLGLSAAIGITAGAAVCIGLWLIFGGWGPPAAEFFGGLGLVGGIVAGQVTFKRGNQRSCNSRQADGQ